MIIIGLSGKKKSGKNTVSKLIATNTNLKVVEIAFADALKQEVARACGVTVVYVEENKDNFRLILQGWGTDYRRKLCNDNYWILAVQNKLRTIEADVVVVTDVRFINEYNWLNRNMGAVLVRIARPDIQIDDHVSESALDKVSNWHHIILNSTTIDDLVPQVKELLNKIKIPIK